MGSGKELTARVLHAWSHRSEAPFVILPAATMAPERIEDELFGTEDPSGGVQRAGALEEAHGGTLFIDEVADMPVETQGKVVRVLVEQTFLRVGGCQEGAGRCPHRLIDEPRSRGADHRRAGSARTCFTG